VTNPGILVEVTSPSTEDYDRGEKLRHYKLIPSVREIVIISHRGPGVTVHRRDAEDRWVEEEAGAGQTIELPSLAARLAVDDIYRDELEDVTPPA
jgi:Uma2 family endonuclease